MECVCYWTFWMARWIEVDTLDVIKAVVYRLYFQFHLVQIHDRQPFTSKRLE